jgi:iron(III) transport system substrate-binding protein
MVLFAGLVTWPLRYSSHRLAAAVRLLAPFWFVVAGFAPPAFAQSGVKPLVQLAQAEAERTEKLIEGAKREGTATVYSSAATDDVAALAAAFEKKYGIKVRMWRSSSENIIQRAVAEARGGRFEVDVIETGGLAMEAMRREQLFREVNTPALSGLIPAAIPAHREWIGTRYNIFAAAYNTTLIKPDELPKRYDDLKDRRWRGKLGLEADDSDWFGAIVGALGEDKGLQLFRDIVAVNGMSVRKGHTLLANLVVSGEVPFALTTYVYKVEQLRKRGAPLAWLLIPPAFARLEGAGVARRAAHPNAAALYLEFLLTDAQELLRDRDFAPTRGKAAALPDGASIGFIDPAEGLDQYQKWSRYFREIVINQAR